MPVGGTNCISRILLVFLAASGWSYLRKTGRQNKLKKNSKDVKNEKENLAQQEPEATKNYISMCLNPSPID